MEGGSAIVDTTWARVWCVTVRSTTGANHLWLLALVVRGRLGSYLEEREAKSGATRKPKIRPFRKWNRVAWPLNLLPCFRGGAELRSTNDTIRLARMACMNPRHTVPQKLELRVPSGAHARLAPSIFDRNGANGTYLAIENNKPSVRGRSPLDPSAGRDMGNGGS